jgi:hypothetical protein
MGLPLSTKRRIEPSLKFCLVQRGLVPCSLGYRSANSSPTLRTTARARPWPFPPSRKMYPSGGRRPAGSRLPRAHVRPQTVSQAPPKGCNAVHAWEHRTSFPAAPDDGDVAVGSRRIPTTGTSLGSNRSHTVAMQAGRSHNAVSSRIATQHEEPGRGHIITGPRKTECVQSSCWSPCGTSVELAALETGHTGLAGVSRQGERIRPSSRSASDASRIAATGLRHMMSAPSI